MKTISRRAFRSKRAAAIATAIAGLLGVGVAHPANAKTDQEPNRRGGVGESDIPVLTLPTPQLPIRARVVLFPILTPSLSKRAVRLVEEPPGDLEVGQQLPQLPNPPAE